MSERNLLSPALTHTGSQLGQSGIRSSSPNSLSSPSRHNLRPSASTTSMDQPRRTSFGFLRSSTRRLGRSGHPQTVPEEPITSKTAPILPLHLPLPSLQDGLEGINLGALGSTASPSRTNTGLSSDTSFLSPEQPARTPSSHLIPSSPLSPIGSRMSYAGSTFTNTLAFRRRRRRDPVAFNVLVLGTKKSGKSSFVDLLRYTLGAGKFPVQSSPTVESELEGEHGFTAHYIEKEFSGDRVGVTVWDSPPLDPSISKLQITQLSRFLESRFEQRFLEEQKVIRSPCIQETHIHCVFLLLDPSRLDTNLLWSEKGDAGSTVDFPFVLDPTNSFSKRPNLVGILDDQVDIAVMEALSDKTVVVPVISKADTITHKHMKRLKERVAQSMALAKIHPFSIFRLLDVEDEDSEEEDGDLEGYESEDDYEPFPKPISDKVTVDSLAASDGDVSSVGTVPLSRSSFNVPLNHTTASTMIHSGRPSASRSILPFSVLCPESYNDTRVGRDFSWGFADPFNPDHCDFHQLIDFIFSRRRLALREVSTKIWYEKWRTSRLKALRDAQAARAAAAVRKSPSESTSGPVHASTFPVISASTRVG